MVTNQILEIDKFADPDSGEFRTHFGGGGSLWTPPSVDTDSDDGDVSIVYPVPNSQNPIERLSGFQFWHLFRDAGWQEIDTNGAFPQHRDLLVNLIKLAKATTEEILRFVKVWGPLYFCDTHLDYCWRPVKDLNDSTKCQWPGREPVNVFRQVAAELDGVSRITASLREGDPAPYNAWQMIPGCGRFESEKPIGDQKIWLTGVINENLRKRGAGWSFTWAEEGSEPELRVDAGFGFIAIAWFQVAQLLTASSGVYICSGCGTPYVRRKRKPKPGTRNYCPTCGKRAAQRDWIREKRRNTKQCTLTTTS